MQRYNKNLFITLLNILWNLRHQSSFIWLLLRRIVLIIVKWQKILYAKPPIDIQKLYNNTNIETYMTVEAVWFCWAYITFLAILKVNPHFFQMCLTWKLRYLNELLFALSNFAITQYYKNKDWFVKHLLSMHLYFW